MWTYEEFIKSSPLVFVSLSAVLISNYGHQLPLQVWPSRAHPLVFEYCDTPADVLAFRATCRHIHQVWLAGGAHCDMANLAAPEELVQRGADSGGHTRPRRPLPLSPTSFSLQAQWASSRSGVMVREFDLILSPRYVRQRRLEAELQNKLPPMDIRPGNLGGDARPPTLTELWAVLALRETLHAA